MPASPHAPTRFHIYVETHLQVMDRLLSRGFVRRDNLVVEPGSREVVIEGEVACLGNIVIHVQKTLEVLDGDPVTDRGALVRTVMYAYNASVRGRDTFLRHDNVHPHQGHSDAHHRHEFDWRTGAELTGSPRWVGTSGWPTLGAFIDEVAEWYFAHREELPEPDAIAKLGLR